MTGEDIHGRVMGAQ